MTPTHTVPPAPGRRRRAAPPAPRPGAAVQIVARRVHFLAGIVVAPFLAVLCLTGLVYVFSPQVHDSLYHSDLHVSQVGDAALPLSAQVGAALAAHPEAELKEVLTPPSADRTTRVVLRVPGPAGTPDRTVYVDPYHGWINGELATVDNRLPANTWLRRLHSNLQLGEPGRLYAEVAASWLPLIVVGGLALWFARTRRKRAAREVLLPAVAGKKGWQRLRSVHGSAGLWLTAGLLVVGVTGLAMSQFAGGRADQSVDPVHLCAPVLAAAPVPVPAGGRPIDVDEAVAAARAAGLSGELSVTPPSGADAPYVVAETTEGLPVHRGVVAIDPYTATVTEQLGWADYPWTAKLTALGTEFHTGSLFGLANQIVLAAVALATLVLLALGYRMWWIHNPYRGRWASLPRPLWRQLPGRWLTAVLLGVAALAWVLPVFGASLVVFLLADAAVTRHLRRRNARGTSAARTSAA